ncbi:MAG: hypothetical protein Q7S70_00380 [bacterium]|nr:hypothetical protein [bacterium]
MISDRRTKEVRTALDELWKKAGLKGWCWGPKGVKNCFSGTNLVLEVNGELVAVSDRDGQLSVSEFCRTEQTKLGRKVREALLRAGLLPAGEEEALSLSGGNYTWLCHVCKKRGQIDPTGIEDPAILAEKLYSAHREAAKEARRECSDKNVQILDPQMRECKELQELVALQRIG